MKEIDWHKIDAELECPSIRWARDVAMLIEYHKQLMEMLGEHKHMDVLNGRYSMTMELFEEEKTCPACKRRLP